MWRREGCAGVGQVGTDADPKVVLVFTIRCALHNLSLFLDDVDMECGDGLSLACLGMMKNQVGLVPGICEDEIKEKVCWERKTVVATRSEV